VQSSDTPRPRLVNNADPQGERGSLAPAASPALVHGRSTVFLILTLRRSTNMICRPRDDGTRASPTRRLPAWVRRLVRVFLPRILPKPSMMPPTLPGRQHNKAPATNFLRQPKKNGDVQRGQRPRTRQVRQANGLSRRTKCIPPARGRKEGGPRARLRLAAKSARDGSASRST